MIRRRQSIQDKLRKYYKLFRIFNIIQGFPGLKARDSVFGFNSWIFGLPFQNQKFTHLQKTTILIKQVISLPDQNESPKGGYIDLNRMVLTFKWPFGIYVQKLCA